MKKTLLHRIVMYSGKFIAILFIQILTMTVLSATDLTAQRISSVKNIVVNLDLTQASIKEAFDDIEKKTYLHFSYDNQIVNNDLKINYHKQGPVSDLLIEISRLGGLQFKQINENVHVNKRKGSTKEIDVVIFDTRITGQVLSEEDEPLPGVNVLVKGTTIGTVTDLDGKYSLTIPDGKNTLIFSFIGYKSQEVLIDNRKEVNVQLEPDITALEEVVVVAFGEQKKQDLVASVTSIKPAELKVPSSNLTTAMAGRVSGMISYQPSGEPGQDNAQFFIRGVTTFGYKSDPLILIDGIESTSTDLARLHPDDIESFSIMKDATATALYGSRAANGVILIKSKEGKEGKATVSVRLENSVSMPTREVELADPITYMTLNNEAVLTRDPLGQLPYTQEKIEKTREGGNSLVYPSTDWRNELIKDYTMNQRANINVKGGGQVARYYVAASFNHDNGLLKVDNRNNFNNNVSLKTYSLRSNVNINLTKTTELDVLLYGAFDDYAGPISGGAQVYWDIMHTNPTRFPAYFPIDAEHEHVQHIMFGNYQNDGGGFSRNPYAELVRGYKEYSRSNMNAQLQLQQDLSFLVKGLRARARVNTRKYTYFDVTRQYAPYWYSVQNYDKYSDQYSIELLNEEGGREYLDYVPGGKDVQSHFYFESSLNYSGEINKIHKVGGALVFLVQNRLTGNAGNLQSSLPFRNVGLAGRATYSYKDRYFTELSFGYNASERFYKDHRWGLFPAVGLAWNVSNEPFWEPLKQKITLFKLRGTYGISGNDAIGAPGDRFLYLSDVNLNDPAHGAVFGTNNGYYRNGMGIYRYSDPNITWEKAAKTNIGVEIGIMDQLNFQADFYRELRTNILQSRADIPAEMGLSAQPQSNIGEVEGKGVDLSLDYNHYFNNSFWLQARGNFTYATSEFKVFEEPEYPDAPWKSRRGYPISQQWGYLAERLFVDDAETQKSPQQFGQYGGGDIKYHDVNGDGRITALDEVPIGYPTIPEIVYGFGLSVGYKNFDFSIFFQGLGRRSFWIDANGTAPFRGDTQLLKAYADDHWSEEDQDIYALWPRLSSNASGNDNNNVRNTWFMRNGSFLRLKQVELGYNVPANVTTKLKMKSLRIYLNSTNPMVWSKFKLWDPEVGGNGLGYPIQKVFNVGLLANF
ncbi:SusC/RagA family TonB-linked outer membrane protein [Fulvivirga ligni]|uniref:SusC/RagA family TonB-linked outer membrane protein n=1 Tax=Fulvivirga ligni TaxID=2904246 RepID=UPI001F20DE43|nr:TonB-dependent receptor [Fulvivirga ligni]UII21462.1 TonB-dependent receptor [Fulvivirga ligni]